LRAARCFWGLTDCIQAGFESLLAAHPGHGANGFHAVGEGRYEAEILAYILLADPPDRGRFPGAKVAKGGGVCDQCVAETKRKIERRLKRNSASGIGFDLAVMLGKMWRLRPDVGGANASCALPSVDGSHSVFRPNRSLTGLQCRICKATQHGRNAEGVSMSGDSEVPSPGRFRVINNSFAELIRWAYRIKEYQVSGPKWLNDDSECFDIEAKMPPGTPQAQLRLMLQTLLQEQFKTSIMRSA
jgi:hypothetical protein